MAEMKRRLPIFRRYINTAVIAASGRWDIKPVEDNTRPIAKYAPYDSFQVQNNSGVNIRVLPNGSSDRAVTIFAGNGSIMQDHKYDWLQINNLDTVNDAAANTIEVHVGLGIIGELR